MPKARKSSTDQDITQASVAQLARFTAKILRLHLASQHLSTAGTNATMARRLHDTIHAPDAPAQWHKVNSSTSQPQQDATLTLRQQSDGPVSFQKQGTQQQQGTLQQDMQQLREANPAVTSPLQQHTDVTPAIAPTASTELARLFDQFIRQAIPSQAVPPTGQPPAPLSPALIDVTLPMVQPQTQLHSPGTTTDAATAGTATDATTTVAATDTATTAGTAIDTTATAAATATATPATSTTSTAVAPANAASTAATTATTTTEHFPATASASANPTAATDTQR